MSITDWTPQDAADEHPERHRKPELCPKCQSDDTDWMHLQPTFYLPECDYLYCNECEHQWGQT